MALPCRSLAAIRCFTTCSRLCGRKINIQKPLVPGTERRILDAVTIPIFPPDPRPLPQQCYDQMQLKKQTTDTQKSNAELLEAYAAFRLQEAIKMFNENSMVAICHILPMTSRDNFNVRSKIITAGMKLMYVRNYLARKATQNTRLHNLKPYLVSNNVYIVSEGNLLSKLVDVLKKTPELQLLGGIAENRILSRDEIMNTVKLPPLDIMRGQLLTILSASAGRTSRLLSRHQQELSANLDQLVKQSGGLKEGISVGNQNAGIVDGDGQSVGDIKA